MPKQVYSRVCELACDCRNYREVLVLGVPHLSVALELLADFCECILSSWAVEFVEDYEVCEVEGC